MTADGASGAPAPGRGRPLAASTYLRRNLRRVVPIALVQALVTALLVVMITPTNVFETTSDAYVDVLRRFTIVTPRVRNDFDAGLEAVLDANPGQAARVRAKVLWIRTPMIVGEAYAPLLAVGRDDLAAFLERIGARLVRGTLPAPGTDQAAVHVGILRARGLAIGDVFGQLADPDDATPGRFTVSGELDGPARLGVVDLAYASIPDFVLARRESFQVVYAKDGAKEASDRYLREAEAPGTGDGREPAFRVVDESFVRRRIEKTMENLPVLIGFLTGAVSIIVALVTALLNVIAFQARVDEFGLYLAVGLRRRRLVRKLVAETSATSLAGWLAGLGLGVALLALWRHLALEPKGILIRLLDLRPFLFSLAVPFLSAAVSAVVLAHRLRRMDPVAVVQRRGT